MTERTAALARPTAIPPERLCWGLWNGRFEDGTPFVERTETGWTERLLTVQATVEGERVSIGAWAPWAADMVEAAVAGAVAAGAANVVVMRHEQHRLDKAGTRKPWSPQPIIGTTRREARARKTAALDKARKHAAEQVEILRAVILDLAAKGQRLPRLEVLS